MKPTLGDQALIDRFVAYHEAPLNGAWGSLHIVLDDGNVDDSSVRHCKDWAVERGDAEGAALADILLTMSKTQRHKLPNKVWAVIKAKAQSPAP